MTRFLRQRHHRREMPRWRSAGRRPDWRHLKGSEEEFRLGRFDAVPQKRRPDSYHADPRGKGDAIDQLDASRWGDATLHLDAVLKTAGRRRTGLTHRVDAPVLHRIGPEHDAPASANLDGRAQNHPRLVPQPIGADPQESPAV